MPSLQAAFLIFTFGTGSSVSRKFSRVIVLNISSIPLFCFSFSEKKYFSFLGYLSLPLLSLWPFLPFCSLIFIFLVTLCFLPCLLFYSLFYYIPSWKHWMLSFIPDIILMFASLVFLSSNNSAFIYDFIHFCARILISDSCSFSYPQMLVIYSIQFVVCFSFSFVFAVFFFILVVYVERGFSSVVLNLIFWF